MKVDGVTKLRFEDEWFYYREERYPYASINSIIFRAIITKHSVNFIPAGTTYQANLFLRFDNGKQIEIHPDTSMFGKLRRSGMEGLHRAKEILCDITFNKRIERFEAQVRDRSYFQIGRYQIHRNGDVFKDGRHIMNVRDSNASVLLGPFQLAFKIKKTMGERLRNVLAKSEFVLNIDSDRDCILYMLKNYLGIRWEREYVREKKVDRRELFYATVLRFGALICSIDGQVDPRELNEIKRFFAISTDEFPNAAKIFNEQLTSRSSLEKILSPFADEFAELNEAKESFLLGMLSVSLSDGLLHPSEFDLIRRAAFLLGLGEAGLARICAAAGVNIDGGSERRTSHNGAPGKQNGSERERYLRVLGLDIRADRTLIVQKYRELAKRYHPDILRGQQLGEEDVRRAERIFVEINIAYEWLQKNA